MAASGKKYLLALFNVIIVGKIPYGAVLVRALLNRRAWGGRESFVTPSRKLLTPDFRVGVLFAPTHIDKVELSGGISKLLRKVEHAGCLRNDIRLGQSFS